MCMVLTSNDYFLPKVVSFSQKTENSGPLYTVHIIDTNEWFDDDIMVKSRRGG